MRDARIAIAKPARPPTAMKSPVLLACASLLFVSSFGLPVKAQPAPAAPAAAVEAVEAEVSSIKFGDARFGRDTWVEATVELVLKPGGRAVSGRFVDRVGVVLNLGAESTNQKGEKVTVFFRASSEAITLEGGRALFRFYLPPEIVARDKLRPEFHVVELTVGGRTLPLLKANASSNITSTESVKNFLAKVLSDSGANEGLLMPQHLTPFAHDPQRPTPTMLRRDSQR